MGAENFLKHECETNPLNQFAIANWFSNEKMAVKIENKKSPPSAIRQLTKAKGGMRAAIREDWLSHTRNI